MFIPPPLLYASPILVASLIHSRRPWSISDGNAMALAVVGVTAIAIGIAVGLASVDSFRKANTTILPAGRPTTAIVARGPYRFTRNPMYLAMAFAYFGLSTVLNNAWALLFLPMVVAGIDRFVIRREERYLTQKFGEAYLRYCQRVRRWI